MSNFKVQGYLLEAPLDVLHSASQEWLQEIEFYKDEIAFFYNLLRQKSKADPSALKTDKAHDIERHLIHISVHTVNELEREVNSHERFLARIIEKPEPDQQLYRNQHHILAAKVNSFKKEFIDLKKQVFELSKSTSIPV